MKNKLQSILLLGVLLVSIALMMALRFPEHTVTKKNETKIKIVNKSNLDIDHIYFSPPDKNTWDEDDVLGDDEVLEPNEAITVLVECGTWDVKLILEDGGTCLGYDEHICGHEVWEITNADCNGDGKEDDGK
jgi:hypothetical protein